MKNAYSTFKTDAAIETEIGVILDYGDFRVRTARAGGANKKFLNYLQAQMKPYARQIATDTMDDEVATRIVADCYAKTVILGMEVKVRDDENSTPDKEVFKFVPGVQSEDGGYGEDTVANRIKFFIDLPELFKDIQKQANDFALFRAVQVEDITKN